MEHTFRKRYDFEVLVNEAERMVVEELEEQLAARADPAICLCDDCVVDMAAYALNMLKPLYRVSLLGTLYAHALDETGYAKEVERTVAAAIDKIHSNPSHD